jgi:tripartite-type tricarboxylate transporter receptor subunit TctC
VARCRHGNRLRFDLNVQRNGGFGMKPNKPKIRFAALLAFCWLFLLSDSAFSQAPFYQDKTITIIQGREPGALGDNRVRALVPFLKKYLPGNPAIVSEFMPGAGGRKATNHIFSVVRPDGLTIGNVGAGLVANAVLGEPGVQYDLDKLIYLGSPNSATHYVFLTKKELGLNSLEKLLAYSGLRIGGQTVGHDIYINGRLFGWILGVKEPRFIPGYGGTELDLALMQGEVDARAQTAAWLVHRNPDWLEKGLVDVHTGIEIPKGERHPRFARLPELESFAKSEKERQILALFRSIRLAGSPYILPPGTPKELVGILQEAIRKSFKDPEFHKEFKKLTGDVPTPLMPETMEKYIREIPRSPEIIALFHKIGGAGPLPAR